MKTIRGIYDGRSFLEELRGERGREILLELKNLDKS